MTDDDARLLERVKLDFWERLNGLKRRATELRDNPNNAPPDAVLGRHRERALTDKTVIDWLNDINDPNYVLGRICNIEAFAKAGHFTEAWESLHKLERDGNWSWVIATQPPLKTGLKQLQASDTGTDMTKGKISANTSDVLSEMGKLIPRHTVKNAARLVFDKGIGKSAAANSRAWYRDLKRKL